MNDLEFKMKYIKYKLKYLQLKQKEQSGGTKGGGKNLDIIEKGEIISPHETPQSAPANATTPQSAPETPYPASGFKFNKIPQVRSDTPDEFRELVRNIIQSTQHSKVELNIARFVSDVLHDMGDTSRKIRINNGKLEMLPDLDSKTLFQNHLFSNPKIIDILKAGGYRIDAPDEFFKTIQKYHGDSQIGVMNKPTSKFSIQNFMNLDIPPGYYLDVNIVEEPTSENNVIGIIDKGSEKTDIQPGNIWADGNTWFLDGLKSIPKNLDKFRNNLSTKLQEILSKYDNNDLILMLKFIAQEYFNSILKDMFYVNEFYNNLVQYEKIDLELHKGIFYWFLYFTIGENKYKVNITGRGSSELTYDLRSLEVIVNGNEDAGWPLYNIDTHVTDHGQKLIDLCSLVCIVAKAFGDASYKLFISSISIFSQIPHAPLSPVAEGDVAPPSPAPPSPEPLSPAPPSPAPLILCLIASQDRQFIRDLIKTYLSIKQYENITMKIFFQTNLQARLTLLCNGSGYIETENFFNRVIENYRSRAWVSMSIKKMTKEEEVLYTSQDTELFIRYEFLRIILLSSYGELQKQAAAALDEIRNQIPPRPILRTYLENKMENNIDEMIIEVIQGDVLYPQYHDWVVILQEKEEIEDIPKYYLELFRKSLHIESTISMKTLIKDNKALFKEKDAQKASEQTLEELCMTSFSLEDKDHKTLALTFLFMDGYISNYADAMEEFDQNIAKIRSVTGSTTVQFIEYFIYLLNHAPIKATEDMLETFLINTFHLLKLPDKKRVFQKRQGRREDIWEQWMGRCEELIENYPDDFCRFFANLLIINYYSNPNSVQSRGFADINLGLATISEMYIEVSTPSKIKKIPLNDETISICKIGSQSYLFNQHMNFLLKTINLNDVRPPKTKMREWTEEDIYLLYAYCYTDTVQPDISPFKIKPPPEVVLIERSEDDEEGEEEDDEEDDEEAERLVAPGPSTSEGEDSPTEEEERLAKEAEEAERLAEEAERLAKEEVIEYFKSKLENIDDEIKNRVLTNEERRTIQKNITTYLIKKKNDSDYDDKKTLNYFIVSLDPHHNQQKDAIQHKMEKLMTVAYNNIEDEELTDLTVKLLIVIPKTHATRKRVFVDILN